MSYNQTNINLTPKLVKGIIIAVAGIVVLIAGMAFVRPWYNVWSQEMEGKAEFAKAEQNRKIKMRRRAPTSRPRNSTRRLKWNVPREPPKPSA